MRSRARTLGDAYEIFDRTYVFNHPDAAETILRETGGALTKVTRQLGRIVLFPQGVLASDGEPWRKKRKVAQPAFHKEAIEGYAATMLECAAEHASAWRPGDVVRVHEAMQELTLDVVVRALLGARLDGDARFVRAAVDSFMDISSGPIRLPLWVPTPSNLRLRAAMRRVDRLIERIVSARRRRPDGRRDLLSMILSAADADGAPYARVRDEVGVFMFGGHETTSSALTWIWWLLACHPEVDERLGEEVCSTIGDRLPNAGDIPNLVFLDAVVKEALRLYPPIWLTARQVVAPLEIGGYRMAPGADVLFSHYVLHRDARWFEDPDAFRPERWQGGLVERLPRHAYLPFGAGATYCIGQPFAQQEIALVIATVARKLRFVRADAAPVEPQPSISLRPRGPVPLRVLARAVRTR